ncbi:sugar transferase [Indioceanicola profundi]|uniref:sugar transferase n=1 Tax=Indioceanicola profundi TaxID=2220096 RepID=UPI000E6ACA41|nr:sugar transferase [Indioceanicola profundi]
MARESAATWQTAVDPAELSGPYTAGARRATKRTFDFVAALLLVVLLAPALLLIAMIIRLGGGPILIRHQRIGAGGKPFPCLKFRTMCVDADKVLADHLRDNPEAREEWEATFKLRNDPRVTRVGRILRKTSLDELPQLFNVLAGDMSLVGPRPITVKEIPMYGDAYTQYASCTPGLTGLWQISGRSDVGYRERVMLDKRYAENWSLMLDLQILAKTPRVVLFGDGAH